MSEAGGSRANLHGVRHPALAVALKDTVTTDGPKDVGPGFLSYPDDMIEQHYDNILNVVEREARRYERL
jgi:hypothetical protein